MLLSWPMKTRANVLILLSVLTVAFLLAGAALLGQGDLSPEALYRRGLSRMTPLNSDYAGAADLFRQAAERGLPKAQRSLGELYRNGQGVPQDDTEAVNWFRKAADKNDLPAQADLGTMYANGRGVSQDDKEAVKWYRKAANKGNAEGQLGLLDSEPQCVYRTCEEPHSTSTR